MKSPQEITTLLMKIISSETKIPIDEISPAHSFFELGLDSISAVLMMEELEKELGVTLNPMYFWDYPTIEKYASYVAQDVLGNG